MTFLQTGYRIGKLAAAVLGVALSVAVPVFSQTTITLRPDGDGSTKQWTNNAGTACTGATCYTEVNESTGATNCTGTTLVKGSGVLNKAAATTGLIEQYTLSLSGLTTSVSVIDSIVVHACEARGGSSNAGALLRIVLNGGTTECVAGAATTTATFSEFTCTFSSLNTTYVSGTTTLEIGNKTTQARAVSMDVIEAELTYHQVQVGGPTAAAHFAPAVTVLKDHPVASAASIQTDPPCCVSTGYPLNQAVHASPSVTATRSAVNQNAAASVSINTSPGIAVPRAMNKAAAAAFAISPVASGTKAGPQVGNVSAAYKTDPPCCVTLDFPLSITLHTSPVVNAVRQGNTIASVSAGLSMGTNVSVTAVNAAVRQPAVTFHVDQPCCVLLTSPLAVTLSVSPAVTAIMHGNFPRGAVASIQTAAVCQACMQTGFQATIINFATSVATLHGVNGPVSVAPHVAPSVATVLGSNRVIAQSVHVSPAATDSAAHFAVAAQNVQTVPLVNVTAPGVHTVGVSQSISLATNAQESAVVSSNLSASLHLSLSDTAFKNVSKGLTQNLGFGNVATTHRDVLRNLAVSVHFAGTGGIGQSTSGGGAVAIHLAPAVARLRNIPASLNQSFALASSVAAFASRFPAASQSVHFAPSVSVGGTRIEILAQTIRIVPVVVIAQTVSRAEPQSLHVVAAVSANKRTPANEKAVMIVVD